MHPNQINTKKMNTMNTNKTAVETLNVNDYYFNYYGAVLDIKPMSKVYILFTNGAGYGSGSDYEGYSNYDLYQPIKPLYKEMVKVGTASVSHNGYEVSSKIEFFGKSPIKMDIDIENVFCKIFKRNV